jgi:hypothetical protein
MKVVMAWQIEAELSDEPVLDEESKSGTGWGKIVSNADWSSRKSKDP